MRIYSVLFLLCSGFLSVLTGNTIALGQMVSGEYVTDTSITVPKPINFEAERLINGVTIHSSQGAGDSFKENMRVVTSTRLKNIKAVDYLTSTVNQLKRQYQNVKTVEDGVFYIFGRVGRRMVIQLSADGISLRCMMYAVNDGDALVHGFAAIQAIQYSRFSAQFDDVMARIFSNRVQPITGKHAKGIIVDGVFYDRIRKVSMAVPEGMVEGQPQPGDMIKLEPGKQLNNASPYLNVNYSYSQLPIGMGVRELANTKRADLKSRGYENGEMQEITLGSNTWVKSVMFSEGSRGKAFVQYYKRYQRNAFCVTFISDRSRFKDHEERMDGVVASFRFGVEVPQMEKVVYLDPPGSKVALKTSPGKVVNGVFVSDFFQFEVKVPEGWEYPSFSYRWALAYVNDKKLEEDFIGLKIMLVNAEISRRPFRSLEEFLDAGVRGLRVLHPTYKVDEIEMITIKGVDWGRVTGRYLNEDGSYFRYVQYGRYIGRKGYVVSFGAPYEESIKSEDYYREMVSSFKYTGQ